MESRAETKVGIAGVGAIGKALAITLDSKAVPGCSLVALCGRDPAKTKEFARQRLRNPVATATLQELAEISDVVIECAPAQMLEAIATPVLKAGKKLVVLSVGALLDQRHLLEGNFRGQILVPTGALIGLDAVTAAAEGKIHSVRMVTRKPPNGLMGAPYLLENRIDINNLLMPLKVFDGTAREAAKGFPANLNVAVALSLAGIGPDRTILEIWADPKLKRNTHRIEVDSDAASFHMTIENIPSENPKTGRITAQSVIALLRKMRAPLRVGT
jgi:aspartate dehydrogenase